MDKKQIGYKAAKQKVLKTGSSVNSLKEHLRNLYIANSKNHRGKLIDSLRSIKDDIRTKYDTDSLLKDVSPAEMEILLAEIEKEFQEEVEQMQVLAYEDDTQNFIDYMTKEDITCRRCGVSSHKNINDEHKCFSCGFDIAYL